VITYAHNDIFEAAASQWCASGQTSWMFTT